MISRSRRSSAYDILIMALLAWVPSILTARGKVSADTKSYLYLDPARVLREATSMWNPNIGNGTVTHQMLGYLWPMGPFFRVLDALGIADWIAQRLWWGLLVFAAAMGTRRLAMAMGAQRTSALVAAGMYAFSPYFIQYFARLSGLLLPWAGLPWLMWCVYRAREDNSWRWPALFAVVVATVGSVNATSLLMAGTGPALWLVADVVSRTSSVRRTLTFVIRAGTLCIGVSLWWLAGLAIQGKYGLPILRYTESYETVAKASSPQEILRGLGYWFFYGGDKLGRWVGPSVPYLTRPLVMLAGWTACGLALVSLSLVRSRHRFHLVFVLLCALGIAVGAAPLASPSPYGRFFDGIVHNESGFALRSTPRAAPVVLLMLALGAALGIERLRQIERQRGLRNSRILATVMVACIAVNFHPWFLLRATTPSILRDSTLPTYWTGLAEQLNTMSAERDLQHPTRTYETPGSDFANYTWGGTIDPITPGLVDGAYIARELVPYGSDATADLLNAFESRIQEGWYEEGTLAKFSEFLSVTNVVLRNDLQHERYRTPRPEILWRILVDEPNLRTVYTGAEISAASYTPIIDNSSYGSRTVDSYPAVVGWTTTHPKSLLTVTPLEKVVQISGSGDGIVDALAAGLLSPDDAVVYRESLRLSRETRLPADGPAIVTDSNRKAPRRWFSVGSNVGRVERASESPPRDPTDNRLMPFVSDANKKASSDSQTVSVLVGGIESINASAYGNQVTFTPEDRPENAFDGNPYTAWRTGVFSKTAGQFISAVLRSPVSPSTILLSQPTTGVTARKIEQIRVTFSNRMRKAASTVTANFMGRDSLTIQTTNFSFDGIRVDVLSDSFGDRKDFAAAPGIGLAEISIPGVESTEYLRVPLDTNSSSPIFLFTRRRIDPSTPNRFDPDDVLRRLFTTKSTVSYRMSGLLRLNAHADDRRLAEIVGQDEKSFASRKSDGNILATGLNARDGRTDTAWITPLDTPAGSSLITNFGKKGDQTVTLVVRNGAQYSVPSRATIRTSTQRFSIALPQPDSDGRIVAELDEPLSGPVTEVVLSAVNERRFPDYFSEIPRVLPVAISEIYTTEMAAEPDRELPAGCRSDLVAIDGEPVPVRVEGDIRDLLEGGAVSFESCDAGIRIDAGEHQIGPPRGVPNPWITGWNLDRIILTPSSSRVNQTVVHPTSPVVTVRDVSTNRVTADLEIAGPSVLAFAQSVNSGWRASLTSGSTTIDLGSPIVINGYANGWVVPSSGRVVLEWTPQRAIYPALATSLVAFLGCIGIAIASMRRRRTTPLEMMNDESAPVEMPAWWLIPVTLFVFGGPIPGVVAIFASFLRPRWSTLVGTLIGAGTVTWIVGSQWYYRWPPNLDWPGRFSSVTWLALAFLTAAGTRDRTTL